MEITKYMVTGKKLASRADFGAGAAENRAS